MASSRRSACSSPRSKMRFADAADQIAKLADASPRSLDVLSGAAVRAISMRLAEDHAREVRGRMLIALARADWEPADIPELRVGFAEGAIEALIDQGEPAEAEGLLERIEQPEQLSAMAVDRHFAKLWPALETRLGPAAATSVERFARDKLTVYGNSPGLGSGAARRRRCHAAAWPLSGRPRYDAGCPRRRWHKP